MILMDNVGEILIEYVLTFSDNKDGQWETIAIIKTIQVQNQSKNKMYS